MDQSFKDSINRQHPEFAGKQFFIRYCGDYGKPQYWEAHSSLEEAQKAAEAIFEANDSIRLLYIMKGTSWEDADDIFRIDMIVTRTFKSTPIGAVG